MFPRQGQYVLKIMGPVSFACVFSGLASLSYLSLSKLGIFKGNCPGRSLRTVPHAFCDVSVQTLTEWKHRLRAGRFCLLSQGQLLPLEGAEPVGGVSKILKDRAVSRLSGNLWHGRGTKWPSSGGWERPRAGCGHPGAQTS